MTTSNTGDATDPTGNATDDSADATDNPGKATGTPGTDADATVRAELARLRDSIDNIDAAVVHMLAERFKCTQQVGHLKAAHQLPPADPSREAQQIARLRRLAENAKLDPAFAEKLLNFIIAEVIRHHESIADGAGQATGTTGE
ncbi:MULTISPECIES: chorismate mutase [unclassified Streptomyces]|uniref:chorismate mutase n=1 Tax=unclassified Streptomyces TaxID=2593676 RepID=UPI0033A57A41|nr:chorismate mutase [Streptomyces sp. NBC_01176]